MNFGLDLILGLSQSFGGLIMEFEEDLYSYRPNRSIYRVWDFCDGKSFNLYFVHKFVLNSEILYCALLT